MISAKKIITALVISCLTAGCSATSTSSGQENSTSDGDPLAELTFAQNSSEAFNRACYWLKEGNNIFGLERIREGNELSRSEGKLPVIGVEQAMEIVFREGELQAVQEHQIVKDFCRGIGYPIQ